jgi:molybdenum cofactor cytidylyltransferase
MKFGPVPVSESEGSLLVHALSLGRRRLKKGHRLAAEDVASLEAAGLASVLVMQVEAGDVDENAAAAALAEALVTDGISVGPATTGRVNLFASRAGLFRVDAAAIDAFNRIDPALTIATLRDRSPVDDGAMVATIKIIPLAVAGPSLDAGVEVLSAGTILTVRSFRAMRVGLVATTLPHLKASIMDKTRALLEARLARSSSRVVEELRVAHETAAVRDAVSRLAGASDLIVIFGASAVADPQDVIPAAILAAGGTVESVGMPVDPGNLLVLGYLGDKPVIGAPGCARSPKENGFDWVLDRLLAGGARRPSRYCGARRRRAAVGDSVAAAAARARRRGRRWE